MALLIPTLADNVSLYSPVLLAGNTLDEVGELVVSSHVVSLQLAYAQLLQPFRHSVEDLGFLYPVVEVGGGPR